MSTLSDTTKAFLSFLFVLIIASLAMNMFLVWQWLAFQNQVAVTASSVQITLAQAVTDLEGLKEHKFEVRVPIKGDFPISTNVDIEEVVEVSIDQKVRINDKIKVPSIVINDVEVPLADIVVDKEVPANFKKEVPVKFTIPIETSVSVEMVIPVEISLKDAGLVPYINRLQQVLVSINESISKLPQ